jgi:uncharacterized protein (DUF1697 family)
MKDLKLLCENIAFKDVTTYIQSGNIIFSSDENSLTLEQALKSAIKKQYDYDVPTLVLKQSQILTILENNPFDKPIEELYFTLLAATPTKDLEVTTHNDDHIIIKDLCVYVDCVQYGKTKFSNTFLEKKLGVQATTRNYKTMLQLSQL